MTTISEFLRDNAGKIWKITPNSSGELTIQNPYIDEGTAHGWSDETYTSPSNPNVTYATLSDASGNTWYLYPDTDGDLIITDTAPTSNTGIWSDPTYDEHNPSTVTESDTGNEIYESLADSDSKSWYVYPNASGELIITDVEP